VTCKRFDVYFFECDHCGRRMKNVQVEDRMSKVTHKELFFFSRSKRAYRSKRTYDFPGFLLFSEDTTWKRYDIKKFKQTTIT
jgi:hypothetical protein